MFLSTFFLKYHLNKFVLLSFIGFIRLHYLVNSFKVQIHFINLNITYFLKFNKTIYEYYTLF